MSPNILVQGEAMKLAVLGAGSWGTALAQAFSVNFEQVILWARKKSLEKSINENHINDKYFPEFKLNENIKATTDINYAVNNSDVVIIAVPTQSIRSVLSHINLDKEKPFISASKGIEIKTLKLISEIIEEILGIEKAKIFSLSGPSFAREVMQGLPTAVTLAGDICEGKELQKLLNTPTFRLYITEDIRGVEIAGAVKNIIAIATGASDGLGLGNNARASIITRGLYEMTKLATILGGNPQTLYGLAGVGDLVLTATGDLSRNRKFGILLGKGLSVEEALKEVKYVVEGAKTTKAVMKLKKRYNLDLPISETVYKVIYEGLNPKDAVKLLMSREPKKEF